MGENTFQLSVAARAVLAGCFDQEIVLPHLGEGGGLQKLLGPIFKPALFSHRFFYLFPFHKIFAKRRRVTIAVGKPQFGSNPKGNRIHLWLQTVLAAIQGRASIKFVKCKVFPGKRGMFVCSVCCLSLSEIHILHVHKHACSRMCTGVGEREFIMYVWWIASYRWIIVSFPIKPWQRTPRSR